MAAQPRPGNVVVGSTAPAWPDAQPWDMLLFTIAAVVVVLMNLKPLLSRAGAVTEVLMPGDEDSAA